MLEKVIGFLNELERDLEEGGVAIKKCDLQGLDSFDKEQYYRQHKENLNKVKRCGIENRITELKAEIGKALSEINLVKLKEIGFPHILNDDGTITYYIIVDTQIEEIVYKNKNYYVPKDKRNIWVFGTVKVTLDYNRNNIVYYNGDLKGYLHQKPGGSCLCIGSLRASLDKRNRPVEIFLKELQKQFSIANLDSAYYTPNSRLYKELRTFIGRKRLSSKKKFNMEEIRKREEHERIKRERQERIEREEREFAEIIEAGMAGLERGYEIKTEPEIRIEPEIWTEDPLYMYEPYNPYRNPYRYNDNTGMEVAGGVEERRMVGDVLEHKHPGREYWHPISRLHVHVDTDNGVITE